MAKIAKKQSGSSKGIIIGSIVGCIAVVVVGIVVVVVMMLGKGGAREAEQTAATTSPTEGRRSVLVTEDNLDEIMAQPPQESNNADRYTVTMNTYWNFPDGKSKSSNAYVENVNDNSHSVYFDIALEGDESGENIYESPIIPVGGHLSDIKLDKALDDGIYGCVMTYHLVDDDQKTLSTVDVALTINVGDVSPLSGVAE